MTKKRINIRNGRVALPAALLVPAFCVCVLIGCHSGGEQADTAWKAVPYQLTAPTGGVTLDGGVLKTMFDRNRAYLLHSFTVDQMLRPFRERAGVKGPAGKPVASTVWTSLPGSSAGRFLMGAGNTLQWTSDDSLRNAMNAIVAGIDSCREGPYIMAYPPDKFTYSENGNYVRSWVTHGLVAAGKAGNKGAWRLLRGYYDWFDTCRYLPEARDLRLGYQGMIANTEVYFSRVGKPEDIRVLQKYYEEDWWLKALAEGDPKAVWDRPRHTPHTHCYELTALNAYLDLYRATGERRYLDAVLGGWKLFHRYWEHLGGSIAISEGPQYPPGSYYLRNGTGETCCSVFWIELNHRLHLLFPSEEKYVSEEAQSIYNVLLAGQDGTTGVRYHANLDGEKEMGQCNNTCCEGQATRLYGSLPQYVFSLASRGGLYVDLFAAARVDWQVQGKAVSLTMKTHFPYDDKVQLFLKTDGAARFPLTLRIPSWTTDVPVRLNGNAAGTGKPGTFLTLDREWKNGDSVSFSLPMKLRLIRYKGFDQLFSTARYGIVYGPLLMAVAGPLNFVGTVGIRHKPEDFPSWVEADAHQPLHFKVKDHPADSIVPYWQIAGQTFSCFPVIQDPLNFN